MAEKQSSNKIKPSTKRRIADEARGRMSAVRYITRIHESLDQLAAIADDAAKRKTGYTSKQATTLNLRIAALDKTADIAFKALRKLVPDLRPEELNEGEKPNAGNDSDAISAARATLADRLSKITAEAGVVEGAEQTH